MKPSGWFRPKANISRVAKSGKSGRSIMTVLIAEIGPGASSQVVGFGQRVNEPFHLLVVFDGAFCESPRNT